MNIEDVSKEAAFIGIDIKPEELAKLTVDNNFTEDDLNKVYKIFEYLYNRKKDEEVMFCLKFSRLPLKEIKSFENFNFERLKGEGVEELKNLSTLSPLYAKSNLAFIGPQGIGKSHLAMAFGRKCCENRFRTYFIKASELNDRISKAIASNTVPKLMATLLRPVCLIIDEVGRCDFSKLNTRVFFDIVDRRYQKEGPGCMIFTSNKEPNTWIEYFNEEDSLLCALDRIFDNATAFILKGESYRGRRLKTLALETKDK